MTSSPEQKLSADISMQPTVYCVQPTRMNNRICLYVFGQSNSNQSLSTKRSKVTVQAS